MEWVILAVTVGVLTLAYVGSVIDTRRKLNAPRRCLACGASALQINGDDVRCLECGHEGRADGGGELTAEERFAILPPNINGP